VSHPLHIVDVFAERRYAGNPLAVVLDVGDLPGEEMQRIALEMNHSETTFVTSRKPVDGGYDVRIFTPAREIPFAGHPTLGTAWVIRRELAPAGTEAVRLNLGVGQVPVTFEADADGGEVAWLRSPPVRLEATLPAERIAPALGLSPGDIDERAPVQRVSAGIVLTIVPLRSLDALGRSRLVLDAFPPLAANGFLPVVYLFCAEARGAGNDLSARYFFVAHGAREDPATGSATACLGCYLLEHDYLGRSDLSLRIEQGQEVGRPSLLRLRARREAGRPVVSVGGRVIPAVRGELL